MPTLPAALTAVVFLAAVAPAADPPRFDIPKSWTKIDPPYPSFTTPCDEYQVWKTSVIVKGTESNRAQSFTETLFRQKRGDARPVQLEVAVTTHGLQHLLGPGGEVVSGFHAQARTLHLPGRGPIPLRAPRNARLCATGFAADRTLLCIAEMWDLGNSRYERAAMAFPIDRAKGTVGDPIPLRPWQPAATDGYELDLSYGSLLVRGRYVITSGQAPDPQRPEWKISALEVWDTRAGKRVWLQPVNTYRVTAEADARFVYWSVDADLYRRPLDGSGAVTRLALPLKTQRVAFHPPTVFALVPRGEKETVLAGFDLATGDRTDYDLVLNAVPARFHTDMPEDNRTPAVSPDGGWPRDGNRLPLWLDAGGVRTVVGGLAYRVSAGTPVPADAAGGWKPLPAGGK